MKKVIKKIVNKMGYDITAKEVVKIQPVSTLDKMESAMHRLKTIGVNPNAIIDVGAAAGNWTKLAQKFWPNAKFHLIEPLQEQNKYLIPLKEKFPDSVFIHQGVAGDQLGKIEFTVSADLDGSGVYAKGEGEVREINVITIDSIFSEKKIRNLIKLDTHGYEIPILEGAKQILETTDALIIEVYGFYVSPTGPLFHELSDYLLKKGFRLFDIVDVMRRKHDLAFWQADAVYLRADHPIFSNNKYQP